MKWKAVITELVILLGIFILTTALSLLFTSTLFGNVALDINLHDTYFISKFSWLIFMFPPFFVLVVLVYLIRAIAGGFKKRRVNTILVAGVFVNVLILLRIYKFALSIDRMISSAPGGWTIYPPLSALGHAPKHASQTPLSEPFSQLIFIILIIFLILLVISAALTGKNWNINKHEQSEA
jgi:heme/copper-type cytochrome/quinol oxidase subunit 1